jgi:hypothetical protein
MFFRKGLKNIKQNKKFEKVCFVLEKSENKDLYFIATKQLHLVRCSFIHLKFRHWSLVRQQRWVCGKIVKWSEK